MIAMIASIVAGSLLLLSINNFVLSMSDDYNKMLLDMETSQETATAVKVIYNDFINLGLGVDRPENAIVSVGSNSMSFFGDVDHDNIPELVTYLLSDSSETANTYNPSDKILYRQVDGGAQVVLASGVTRFDLEYLDFPRGNATNDVEAIKTIEIALEVQSTEPVSDKYSSYSWSSRVSPPNLMRY
jgi:hypothetical protein